MKTDVLVFAAHPDDAELAMGGTIAKLISENKKVGIIDFTRGEMSTRGNVELRQKEASAAAEILGVSLRSNLEIPDGNIKLNDENLKKVVSAIREHKPSIIFAPYFNDRHPDHVDASRLVKKTMFVSGLKKFETFADGKLQNAYRPQRLFYYMQTYLFNPSFIIDITDFFEQKIDSVKAFASQFYDPNNSNEDTFISRPEFIDYVEARAKFYGFQISKKFGEPFFSEESIELSINNIFN